VIEHHSSLPAAFNSTVGVPRLVLLVSSTCSVCLDGVRTVVTSLEELNARDAAVHVVWVGVLDDDSAAGAAAAMFPDDFGAMHYWDGELQVSKAFHATLGLERWKRNVAWDLYLLYGARSEWTDQPPLPSLWMHQLHLEDVPELDGSLLVEHLGELLNQRGVVR
jgi:hypothetical protein